MFGILFRAEIKTKYGILCRTFTMAFLSFACIICAVTLYMSGMRSVSERMDMLGYGNVTIWVANEPNELSEEIRKMDGIRELTAQRLIYAGYRIGEKYSDNEGQLIYYDRKIPYRFIDEGGRELPVFQIKSGEIYISPALSSTFDVGIGTEIEFEYSRSKKPVTYTVKGYFEDGFMGSSMIDMNSFLVSRQDFDDLLTKVQETKEADALAKRGSMLHVTAQDNIQADKVIWRIMADTDTSLYTEYAYAKESVLSYQTLLQNILCAFLGAFSIILFIMNLITSMKSLSDTIMEEMSDISELRMIGTNGGMLRAVYFILFEGDYLLAYLAAAPIAFIMAGILSKLLVTSTGQLVRIVIPTTIIILIFILMMVTQSITLILRTGHILNIRPVMIGREELTRNNGSFFDIKKPLAFFVALREVETNKRKYTGLFVIAVLLTFFLSVIGRMSAWLGPNGEGLMNAFSVADHDLGVQPFNSSVPMDEIRRAIEWYSPVRETYEIAMQPVYVNGREYTANVLNDTSYFHVLKGKEPKGQEILITDTVADELGIGIGESVQITGEGKTNNYTVSGIYMCANGMGSNIGMSLEGYSHIGDINGYIWCYHYILEKGEIRDFAADFIRENYKGVDVHTNSWSGLEGIVSLMHLMIVVIYLVSAVFIALSVALIMGSLIRSGERTLTIYRTLGMSRKQVRLSFVLRFMIVVGIGSIGGLLLSGLFADRLIGRIFIIAGIGEFHVRSPVFAMVIPFVVILLFFSVFAGISGRRADRISLISNIQKEG